MLRCPKMRRFITKCDEYPPDIGLDDTGSLRAGFTGEQTPVAPPKSVRKAD